MKKIVICGIPMREHVDSIVHTSDDASIPASGQAYRYPVNSFLSQTAKEGDDLKIILLIKKDGNTFYRKNADDYKLEIGSICKSTGLKARFVLIDTDFEQRKETHAQLMGRLVDEIDVGAHIIADITYGPKDLPIVVFSALNFAERFLQCEIDHIVYGKGDFRDGRLASSSLCDMIPLYCLGSVTNMIRCDDAQKARQMLKSLLSL